MKIVIQCAGSKHKNAGSFFLKDGRKVTFVADPSFKTSEEVCVYTRPDDREDQTSLTWRERLLEYNVSENRRNPNNLFPAYRLYTNPAYERLVGKFGINKIFILSAGWGLIPSNFLTPLYEITFSSTASPLNRSAAKQAYDKYCLKEK